MKRTAGLRSLLVTGAILAHAGAPSAQPAGTADHHVPAPAGSEPRVLANDGRQPAGTMSSTTLVLKLRARLKVSGSQRGPTGLG